MSGHERLGLKGGLVATLIAPTVAIGEYHHPALARAATVILTRMKRMPSAAG